MILDDLVREEGRPRDLFEGDIARGARLMKALDSVNDQFGKKSLVLASEGFKRTYVTKADHRSPRYTTRLADLPVVHLR